MSELEMVAKINELQQALTAVIAVWVLTVVLLGLVPDHDCPHCAHCQAMRTIPRCPMCAKKHDPTERCA